MDRKQRFVVYRGMSMIEGWPEKIHQAQLEPMYGIDGVDYPRIRYGGEAIDWGAQEQPCHDCKVIRGELHVIGCDVEECPACGEQAISCDCRYDGDLDEDEDDEDDDFDDDLEDPDDGGRGPLWS